MGLLIFAPLPEEWIAKPVPGCGITFMIMPYKNPLNSKPASDRLLLYTLLLALTELFGLHTATAQQTESSQLLPYLHGVRTKRALLMNISGYEIISERVKGNFSKPFVRTLFPGFDLHQRDRVKPDSIPGIPLLHIEKRDATGPLVKYSNYYFWELGTDSIQGLAIVGLDSSDLPFRRAVIELVRSHAIPDSLISDPEAPVLLFAGRSITVDKRCRWMGSNVMQCSGFGELNWSMHQSLDEAKRHTEFQEIANKAGGMFDLQQENDVPVIFEGTPVIAHRIGFKLKGAKGFLAKNVEGSRMLIVYYVTTEVRGRFISCVLSHWTSDYIEDHGLPPLLGEVMRLKL